MREVQIRERGPNPLARWEPLCLIRRKCKSGDVKGDEQALCGRTQRVSRKLLKVIRKLLSGGVPLTL